MLSMFKIGMDLAIISGTASNITKIFKAVGGNKFNAEKIGGAIFGISLGCWAAGRFNNVVDAVEEACKDLFGEEDKIIDEPKTKVEYKEYVLGKDGKKHYIHKEVAND